MSNFSNIAGDVHFEDRVTFGNTVTLPSNTLGNSQVSDSDPIAANKVEHQFVFRHVQTEAAAIIAATEMVHICRGAGEVLDIEASFGSIVPVATEEITIKVVKHTGAVADDVMTNVFVLDSGNVVHTPEGQAGLDAAAKVTVAGDILEVQVTRAGAEVIARGLIVEITYKETPVD